MIGDLRGIGVEFYADYDILFSSDIEEHKIFLRKVLDRSMKFGATVALRKCLLFQESIHFLCFEVGTGNLNISKERIKVIQDTPNTKNRRGVLKLCGFWNYYAKLIPNYVEIIKQISSLRSPKQPFHWLKHKRIRSRELQKHSLTIP